MKNVAALAGVSFKTVSRVVNGEPGVSRALEERVIAAIAELDYQPDHGARTLRRSAQRSATIGVVHANIANPFMASVHHAFETVATKHNYLILSGTSLEDPERHDELIRAFTERRVDGLLVVPVGAPDAPTSEALEHEHNRGTPIVFVDREPSIDADVVMSDHQGGAELATTHLVQRGHRRIAFLGSRRNVSSVAQRLAGFQSVMSSAGASPAAITTELHTPADATKTVHELLQRRPNERPTALFAAQNELTLGAVRALHELGVQHQIALVGFDHVASADLVEPGITTVPQSSQQVGTLAGELLFERLLGNRSESRREIVPVQLVPRGSGEIPPPS